MSFQKVASNVRAAEVQWGDTLRSIALREMGSAERWTDLIALNGLSPPYISSLRSARVLGYGDLIKVPAPGSPIAFTTNPVEIYGVDIDLSDGLISDNGAGDIGLVSGVANFSQAIRIHVSVGKRELSFHPEFGCWVRSIIGTANGPTAAQLAAFYVKSALVEDSRVEKIESCTARVTGDQISVSATVIPISGKPVDLNLVV